MTKLYGYKASSLYLTLTLAMTLSLLGCGGRREAKGLEWSGGERLRWARVNPCACLNSERLVTSLELRPIAQGEAEDGSGIGLERWERVALRRPLSPEELITLKALKERGSAATQILVNLSIQQSETLEGHVLRVVHSLSLYQGEEEESQDSTDDALEPSESASPISSPEAASSAQRPPVDLP